MKYKKEILLLVISITFSFIVLETGLRIYTNFPIHGLTANRIDHPFLGYTLDPLKVRDSDEAGFRNPEAKGLHNIVAIGDSHTYGHNVQWQDAWPYQLGKSLDKSVYNYGIGGYGIFHYFYVSELAVKHEPEYVLLGLYAPNDIQPSVCTSVSKNYYQELLKRGFAKGDCPPKVKKVRKEPKGNIALAHFSAVFSAWEYLRVKYIRPKMVLEYSSDIHFNIGGILVRKNKISLRNKMTDLSNKKIKNHFEISKKMFSFMHDRLRKKGIKFGVLVIPHRGLVIEQWANNNKIDLPKSFSVEPVSGLIKKYISFFKEKGIPAINVTPYMAEAFKPENNEDPLYPINDSHPMEEGYKVYSQAAEILINKMDQYQTNSIDK